MKILRYKGGRFKITHKDSYDRYICRSCIFYTKYQFLHCPRNMHYDLMCLRRHLKKDKFIPINSRNDMSYYWIVLDKINRIEII